MISRRSLTTGDQDGIRIIRRGAAPLHDDERAPDLKVGRCCSAADATPNRLPG